MKTVKFYENLPEYPEAYFVPYRKGTTLYTNATMVCDVCLLGESNRGDLCQAYSCDGGTFTTRDNAVLTMLELA